MNTNQLFFRIAFTCAVMAVVESRSATAVDGISFEELSPIDAAAFSIVRADKDGDRIYQFTEKSGTHAREVVVVPGDGLQAEAAEVRYPQGKMAERPFVENGKIRLTFAPGEKLSLVWPKEAATSAATPARPLPPRLPEIVGREQSARIVRREVIERDGGAVLEGAAWIWHPDAMQQKAVATLRTTFDIPEGTVVDAATLTFSLDNGGEVRLNGKVVGRQETNSSSWMKLSVIGGGRGATRPTELCALFKPGRNVLEATCDNFIPGDAGFIASLDMTVDGKKMRVFTNDKLWEASLDGKTFKRAKSAGMYGAMPWMRFGADGIAHQKPLKKSCFAELMFDLGKFVPPGRLFLLGDGCRREVTSDLKPGLNKVDVARDVKNPRLIWMAPAQGVYDLRCEYIREPLGVVKPRFFWKWAGERPEAWKVKVWEDGGAVVAQCETREHLYVEPNMTLKPFTRYGWSVEDVVGTFVSGIEKWEKPFFKPPWKHKQTEYWIARKKVTLKDAKSVIIALTSLGSHRLYVNGKPASDCFGPNRSHVEDGILLATTYDVTDLVKDGENEFKVYMHDGWAALGQCKEKESCLSVDGRAITADGIAVIDSAEPWDVSLSADRSYGPIGGNGNGSRRGVEHLCDVERETRHARGVVRTGPVFTVSCDVADRDYAIREIRPVSIGETATPGKWKIDMGEAFSGFMRLKLKGKKGSVARMTASDTFVDECTFGQIAEFEFCGGGGGRGATRPTVCGVFENRMNTQSGRFFYLTGCEKPGLDDVTGIVIGCCGRIHGGFKGDRDLEKILALDRNTFIATTMGGVTVDCPHRERLGYGEASLSAMWGDGMPQFDSAAYYYAYLLKWASSQRPDGSIPHVSPNGYGWGGTFWSNFPVYALADYSRRYPDARLKGIMRPVIDKWLDYLNSHVRPDGILAQYEPKKGDCLGDWLYPEIHKTKHTYGDWGHTVEGMFFNNCAYAWAIKRALGVGGLITDPARRAELERRHAALVKAIDREWYKNGLYVSEDARYQAIALLGGAADAGGHRAETENAMQDIVEWKGYIDGGSPSYMPILRLLCATRRGRELALRTFRRREAPGFLYFADEGYNTIPEDWWYGHSSRGSMIHTCYTGPAGAFFHGFAGFEIDGNKITVAPLLSDTLPNFSTYTETLYGTLWVKVESKGGRRVVWVLCPYGCEGTFVGGGTHVLRPGLNRFECTDSVSGTGGYVIAFDKTGGDDWKMVATALSRKHDAKIVEYDGWSGLVGVLAELKKIKPKYVCFVVPPETARREFVAAAYQMMRLIDKDPYGDAIWGIITGYSAADGMKLVKAPLCREIRSFATSMGGDHALDKWESGFASDERTADNFWMKRPGGANEKVATGGNIAKALADAFNTIPVDYFVTSGHARERNWQIVYNQNKGMLIHTPTGGLQFVEPDGENRHNLTNASLKVYIGAGNCLIGHVDRRVCMATAWMHAAGVEQFVGYTVPSWYGFMGWGVKGLHEEGRYSLAEARYLENERLLWAKTRKHKPTDEKGLAYDQDVFAYYGDPAQRIMFPEDKTPYKVVVKDDAVEVSFTRDCSFAPLDDARGARPIMALLDTPPPGDALIGADGKEVADSVVTERFIFIPVPGKHTAGETLEFKIGTKDVHSNGEM